MLNDSVSQLKSSPELSVLLERLDHLGLVILDYLAHLLFNDVFQVVLGLPDDSRLFEALHKHHSLSHLLA